MSLENACCWQKQVMNKIQKWPGSRNLLVRTFQELSSRRGGEGGAFLSCRRNTSVWDARLFILCFQTSGRSRKLLPPPLLCGFYHVHLQFADFCVDTTTPQPLSVLSGWTRPEAPSRSGEGVWLLSSALVQCCRVDQGELPKDRCRSRNDVSDSSSFVECSKQCSIYG